MQPFRRAVPLALVLLVPLLLAPAAHAAKGSRPSRKSPHCEIVAAATVATPPAAKTHRNGRRFLEFDVVIDSFTRAPEGDKGGDPELPVATGRPVHVVHDLSCGGGALTLANGDKVEIKGEYVAPPNGKDLIHFTHPADGSCGTAGSHPDGWIRPLR